MKRTDAVSETPALSVVAVHHVSFRVDDIDVAMGFYRDVLGCVPRFRPEMGFRGAWLDAGAVQVHLLEGPADATTGTVPSSANGRANHVAFRVPDLAAFEKHLSSWGFEPVRGPVAEVAQIFVQDPSGNVIEINEFD